MAQYIFWTGDETAVVKAVEELVEGKVVSIRNNFNFSLKFILKFYINDFSKLRSCQIT